MIITKMALPRRTFLRGLGATLALPLLDAMVPALSALAKTAAAARPPPRRSSTCRTALMMDKWTPTDDRHGLRAVADAQRRSRRSAISMLVAERARAPAGRVVRRRRRRPFARRPRRG